MKMNLPVILLKNLVLLPNGEIRVEFQQNTSKNILDISLMFHDKNLLVVSTNNPLEEIPAAKDLSSIGVIAKITQKIELPNGEIRVVLKGLKRAKVYEYLNLNHQDETLESIVEILPKEKLEETEEMILSQKLYRELERYIRTVPYMSNSILSSLKEKNNLNDMTDMIASYLPISFTRLQDYLLEVDTKKRVSMLLKDINDQAKIFDIERELDNKVQDQIEENQHDYILREKMRLIKEELGEESNEIDTLKEKIDALECPSKIKIKLQQEYQHFIAMQPMSPEANLVRTYIEWFLKLPWNHMTVDNHSLLDVKHQLDESHAGLEKVKERMIEFLAVHKRTASINGPIICLVGPPGVGKTTLVSSIARAIGRQFVKFSVGGMSDESEVMGHRRTYLGANPGRIISSLSKAGSKNPVFLIDEIDKMTSGIHGDPASSLLEVLDPTQNQYFTDRYLEEEFDLSHVMFMVTANNKEDIPEALRDRLEIIDLSGYTELEKLDIAKKHLIPTVCKSHGIEPDRILISDEILLLLIQNYTREAGVRELKRQLETIIRKVVTGIVIEQEEKPFYTIDQNMIVKYLGKKKYPSIAIKSKSVGVVNGLAYTNYGGDTLSIEVNYYPGSGNLVLTGSLGDVMKESAKIALSYLKANARLFHIPYEMFTKNDIHIHVPEGAIKKDGPSAGIALTTALLSAFTNQLVSSKLAMTGEITLRGRVLPIGGLKEKSIGAVRNGIKTVIVPYDNKHDLDDIPSEIKEKLDYRFVKHYQDVFSMIWDQKKKRKIVHKQNVTNCYIH